MEFKKENKLIFQGLVKEYGKKRVIDKLDGSVVNNRITSLIGPNGAGKTTLINILSTLVKPDGGIVRVAGHSVETDMEDVKQSISLTGQTAAVDEILTAEENLRMMGRLSGLSATASRSRATELLNYFDLTDATHKRVNTFSGGMRRRLDLALSLVVSRPILFLDEPTTGLDTRSRQALWDVIVKLATSGVTIFLTTQYLEEADQLADDIAVLVDGRVVAQGSADELKSRIGGEMIEFRDEQDEIIRSFPSDGSVQDLKHILDLHVGNVTNCTRVSIRRPSMDDVFLALTKKNKEVTSL